MKHLIICNHVNFTYHTLNGETPAINDMHFHVDEGDFVSIVGPSGCGKSTLLSLLCGLLKPGSGEILVKGEPLSDKNRFSIGYMLQQDHLFEWRSVYKNIMLGLEIQNKVNKETQEEALSLLETYGLLEFKDAKPSQLSGGMRQRAALIRTLLLHPDILLLDEPFSALDYQTRLSVADDIYGILKKEGKTAILITHDIAEAISMSERILVLTRRPGRIRKRIDIHLNMEDGRMPEKPSEARGAREFATYYQEIWKELMEDADEIEKAAL